MWRTRVSNHHHIQSTDENLLRPTEQLQCPTKYLMGKFAAYLKFRLDPEDDWVEDELRYGVAVCYALGIGHTQDYLSDLMI